MFIYLLRTDFGLTYQQAEIHGLPRYLASLDVDIRSADIGGTKEIADLLTSIRLLKYLD